MHYISTDFGVYSSSCIPLRARIDRETDTHTKTFVFASFRMVNRALAVSGPTDFEGLRCSQLLRYEMWMNYYYLDHPVADQDVEVGERDELIGEDLGTDETGHEAGVLDLDAHDGSQRPEQKRAQHLHHAGHAVTRSNRRHYDTTSAGWQVTLCDPIWHVSSRRSEACCELLYPFTLLTYLLT